MEKDERAKQASQSKEQAVQKKEQAVQATAVVNGFKDLDSNTLIGIAENGKARDTTRIAALRELHGRSGCQYSGLERLDIGILKRVVEDKTIPQDLRTAAADALAMPRAADKNK